VKNKAILIVASFMLFIVACSDMEKSSVDTTIAAKKEKKVSKPVKTKKKKTTTKPYLTKQKQKADL